MAKSQVQRFQEEPFNASQYCRQLVSQSSSAEQLTQQLAVLQEMKLQTAKTLQQNIHQHAHDFIGFSRTITADLEPELLSMRHSLAELRQIVDELLDSVGSSSSSNPPPPLMDHLISSSSSAATAATVDPSSGADRIEGLDSLLTPGDNVTVILQGSGLIELMMNSPADDLKSSGRSVYLILLSDARLAVAYRKRKRNHNHSATGGKKGQDDKGAFWVVDYVWDFAKQPFSISVNDAVFKLDTVDGKKSVKFRTESEQLKQQWVQALTKFSKNDGGTMVASTVAESTIQTDSLPSWIKNASTTDLTSIQLALNSVETNKNTDVKRAALDKKSGAMNPDLVWLRDMPDELDVYIAHRDFEEAVECIKRARRIINNYINAYSWVSPYQQVLKHQLQRISSQILKNLSNPYLPAYTVQNLLRYLIKLGMPEQAQLAFLQARTRGIRHRVRQIPLEGDATQYVTEIAATVFSWIRKTCLMYQKSFQQDHQLYSGLIKWVRMEMEEFARVFRCQVFYEGQSFRVMADCLYATAEQCRVLTDIGLDVSFMLDQSLFRNDIAKSLEWHQTKLLGAISRSAADDDFESWKVVPRLELPAPEAAVVLSPTSPGGRHRRAADNVPEKPKTVLVAGALTPSIYFFAQTILTFVFSDLAPLLNPESAHRYYSETVQHISSFFERVFRHTLDASHDAQLTDKQLLLLQFNTWFMSQQLFPFIHSTLQNHSALPLPQQVQHYPEFYKKVFDMVLSYPMMLDNRIGFGRVIPEWSKMQKRLQAMHGILQLSFFQRRAQLLAHKTYAFGPACVPSSVESKMAKLFADYNSPLFPVDEQLLPSESMVRFIKDLGKVVSSVDVLRADLTRGLGANWTSSLLSEQQTLPLALDRVGLVSGILHSFFHNIMEDKNWTVQPHGYDKPFGYTGLHQFILDMHFLLKVGDMFVTPQITRTATDACSRALKLYFKQQTDNTRVLKAGEWYDGRVEAAMKKFSKEIAPILSST